MDTRKFRFRLHRPGGARVTAVYVYVNGLRKLRIRGTDIRTVTLKRLPQSRFNVRIDAVQSTGARLVSARTYRGCRKGAPRGRHGRPSR